MSDSVTVELIKYVGKEELLMSDSLAVQLIDKVDILSFGVCLCAVMLAALVLVIGCKRWK